jgi:hypothetical protein
MDSYSPIYRPTLIEPTPAPSSGKNSFKDAKRITDPGTLVELGNGASGTRVYEPAKGQPPIDQAFFSGSEKNRALFKSDVNTIEMSGEPGGVAQASVLGNTRSIFQRGQGATQDVFTLSDTTELLNQGGTHNKNYFMSPGVVKDVLMEGTDNQNQITASGVENLYMTGESRKATQLNDVSIMGNTGKAYLGGEANQNQASFMGRVDVIGVEGEATDSSISAMKDVGQLTLDGKKNATSFHTDTVARVASITTEGSSNAVSAEAGIQRLASGGKNNTNEYFSYAGQKATEAIFHGEVNKTLYGASGEATIRVGGKGNETTISTSRVADKPEQANDEATVKAQNDTLELGGSNNTTTADLGVGDDAIFVHNEKSNLNNTAQIDAGDGRNTLTLEGDKKSWRVTEDKDNTLLIANSATQQRIVAKEIDKKDIKFIKELPPGKVGYQEGDMPNKPPKSNA